MRFSVSGAMLFTYQKRPSASGTGTITVRVPLPHDIELEIDMDALARKLGQKASENRSRTTKLAEGLIKCTARRKP